MEPRVGSKFRLSRKIGSGSLFQAPFALLSLFSNWRTQCLYIPRGSIAKRMSWSLAAVAGFAAGSLVLLVVSVMLLGLYLFRRRAISIKNSDTGSSDPSTGVEWNKGAGISSSGSGPPVDYQGARRFSLEELEQATRNFVESNIVGTGSFGLVYKGLLLDGTVVAIKRRIGAPRQDFVEEECLNGEFVKVGPNPKFVPVVGYH